jgi:CheY-like chemotaxis protein
MIETQTPAETILLVDDNSSNLQVLFKTLEALGCKQLVAKNSAAALAICAKSPPELILLDIMMPGIDNRNLCKVNRNSFVTALYAVFDGNDRSLRMVRAGHPLPMLYRFAEGRTTEPQCPGVFPMGYIEYPKIPVTEITLEPGDRLLFYTDGITERFNLQNEPYGEQRLRAELAQTDGQTPSDLLHAIRISLEYFAAGRPADDDQILLAGYFT